MSPADPAATLVASNAPAPAILAPSSFSLRLWLVLLVAAVALPLLALAAVAILRGQHAARERLENQMQLQASTLAVALDGEFAAAAAIVRTLANSAALARGDLDEFRAEMDIAAQQSETIGIGLSDREGHQLLLTITPPGSTVPPGTPANLAVAPAMRTGRVAVSNLYLGAVSQHAQVAVAVPVPHNPSGRTGAVSTALPAEGFTRLITAHPLPAGWVATILDREFRVVARSRRGAEFVGQVAPQTFITVAERAPMGLLRERRIDGVESVIAYTRATESGFTASLAVSAAAFDAPLRQSLRELLLVGVPLTLAGLGLAGLLGTRIVAAISALAAPGRATGARPRFREVDLIAQRLVAAERWRVVLMDEMNHRVKNTLMTVQSLAAQTLRGSTDDPARFNKDFAARLATLARAHDLLTATGWQSIPIEAAMTAGLSPWLGLAGHPIRLHRVEKFDLGPRQAQALVLALHELGTNAAKHGALSAPGGLVHLRCVREADDMACITWVETGGPAVAAEPGGSGFGTRLLERVLPNDLGPGSTVERRYEAKGLHARIRFRPVAAPALAPLPRD